MTDTGNPVDKADLLRKSLARIQELKSRVEELETERHDPIAIVGIGTRFPAGMRDPDSFWHALLEGVDVIDEIPEERWPRGQAGATFAGMIEEPYGFDPGFFGISEREAKMMDPQQRLLLEVGWNAIADAGLPLHDVRGSETGVYIGAIGQDWTLLACSDADAIDAYTSTGASHAIIANRLSYLWDLRGPSMTVDVACASSLVAVHLAVTALRRRECSMALAGGVQLHLAPESTLSLHRFNMMAPDGRCKAFDVRADGFVRAEGCGVVVLKRLSDARASNDRIHAVIHGSALNQDGRSNGLTAPNALAQANVLRAALRDARLVAEDIGYIETHGTGTALGDPIEVEAIKSVYGTHAGSECYLGAIKTNLGHTEAAAGIAGLIKAALVLRNKVLPKNLHLTRVNPDLALDGTRFRIPTSTLHLDGLRHAAVSSFGFGGTNAHVVLGVAPELAEVEPELARPLMIPISAHGPGEFGARARQLASLAKRARLDDLAFTASLKTTHLPWRAVAVGSSVEQLEAGFEAAHPVRRTANKPRVVFLFPGQGGQWVRMGAQLAAWSPIFRAALDECADSIARIAGWSLASTLESEAELARVDRVQPAIFALQVASSALWRALGVTPDVVIGTSMGEVAAAHAAGLLGLDDAVRVITGRSRLIAEQLVTPGGMATVALAADELQQRLNRTPSDLEIAVINSPTNVVVAGSPEPLDALLADLQTDGVFARRIQVDYASHCSHVDSLAIELQRQLSGLRPGTSARIPMLSTVTCEWLTDATAASYWQHNLRASVRLWPAITEVLRPEEDFFVEISPHPVLTVPLEDPLSVVAPTSHIACGMARKADVKLFLEAVGAAWAHGVPIDWRTLAPSGRLLSLPSYPWDRHTYAGSKRTRSSTSEHITTERATAERVDAEVVHDESMEAFIITAIARELALRSPGDLQLDISLRDLGLDSLMASHLRATLAKRSIKVTLLDILQAPSVKHLIRSLNAAAPTPMSTPARAGSWLVCPRPRPAAEMVCVCFPFGGGSAGAFRSWAESMPEWLEIRAVEYPGRGTRSDEPWANSFEEIAEAVCDVIVREVDRPFILYGHCSGTIAAYETAKRLLAAGRPPRHLYVAALRSPAKFNLVELLDVTDVLDGVLHEQEDEQLMGFLRAVNFRGVDEIAADEELRQMALSTLRADSRISHRYRRADAPPLALPITALGGGQDPSINTYDLWAWSSETSDRFDWRWFPAGDHYFHSDHIPELATLFESLLSGATELPLRPMTMDGEDLTPLDVVRSFFAARGEGTEAWSLFVAAEASWTGHAAPGMKPGHEPSTLRAWLAAQPSIGAFTYSDLAMTLDQNDVCVSARVTLVTHEARRLTYAARERYAVRNHQIAACESWFEPT